jgi:sugar lactone lactonase YvrE
MGSAFSVRAVPLLVLFLAAAAALPGAQATPWQTYESTGMWGSVGNGAGQFSSGAYGLARNAAGVIFVSDRLNGRIEEFDGSGTYLGQFGTLGTGIGQLRYPEGIAVDGLGRIYVAEGSYGRVQRFRWDGEAGQYVHDLIVTSGMFSAAGVAVDSTGQIVYVSDFSVARIDKLVWDGSQYVLAARLGRNGGGGSSGEGPGEFWGPMQISLTPAGYLYVADSLNNRIQKWGPNDTFVRSYGSLGSGPGEFRFPRMAVEDAEGNLYVTDAGNHRVQKLDADGNVLAILGKNGGDGTAGNGAGEFNWPFGLLLGPDNTLYVGEDEGNRVQSFRLRTVTLSGVVTTAAKSGLAGVTVSALGLEAQATTAADGSFSLTVPLGWSGRLQPFLAGQEFTPTVRDVSSVAAGLAGLDFAARPVLPGYHSFARAFSSPGSGPGQLNRPWHVALDAQGYVYVADQNNHRVLKFAADGAFVTLWGRNGGDGTAGSGDGELNAPCGVVVDHAGCVYVADHYNHRVQKFDANGGFLRKWGRNGGDGSAGSGAGEFSLPIGLAVDAAGSIFVGESGNARIQKFDCDGNLLHTWASGIGHGVAIDGAGRVYTLTYTESVVRQYTWSGAASTYLQTAGWPVAGNPGGFCVDGAGTLYVAETWAHRVRRFTPDGTELTQWGSGGSGLAQFSIPCGVTVSHDGWVYVSDTGNNRIQKFRRTDDPPRTVTFLPGAGGALTGTTPQTVDHGAASTPVTALPDPCYHFVRWTRANDLFSTDNPITLASVTADLTLTAEFAIDRHSLTYLAGANGSLSEPAPQTVDCGSDGAPVTATAAPCYHFVRWSDGSEANPRTDTNIAADLTVTAEFAIDRHRLTYLAGANGSLSDPASQTVDCGSDGAPVTALPAPYYRFVRWSDGSEANPRTDLDVSATLTVTAAFETAAAVTPGGDSVATQDAGAVAAGRGLWDLSGTYTTAVDGLPLVIHLVHDSRGKLTGTATLTIAMAEAAMSVRGAVSGVGGGVAARFTLKSAGSNRGLRAALDATLTLNPATRQLGGQITGTLQAAGATAPVAGPVTLDLPAAMDGTWSLRFALVPGTRGVGGNATLTLSNGVTYGYVVRARLSGLKLVGDLISSPADALATGIRIRATMSQYSGGWARLETLSGSGYGQNLGW